MRTLFDRVLYLPVAAYQHITSVQNSYIREIYEAKMERQERPLRTDSSVSGGKLDISIAQIK